MESIRPLNKKSALFLAILMATLALQFDLSQPLGVSAGMPYVVLPLLGLLARSSMFIVAAALAGSILIGIGMLLSTPGVEFSVVLLNRALSVVLIWVTAIMALHHLHVGNKLQQRLQDLAATDPLTGLYNRRHVFNLLRQELKRYERYGESFALVLIDADYFKRINDTHGHAVGDATLVAERIRLAMHNADAETRGDAAKVTLSFGVAEVGPNSATFDDILKAADDALYAAKRAGRDRVARFADGRPKPRVVHAA